MYRLLDRWTTLHGRWETSDEAYSIDQEHLERWGNEPIDGKGCGNCIFVKLEGGPEDVVHFETVAGLVEEHPVDPHRWAHTTMYEGSNYNPTRTKGPWFVRAQDQSEIVDDIGRPGGEHVSHFVVLRWEEEEVGGGPDPVPEIPPETNTLQVAVKIGETIYQGTLRKMEKPNG